MTEKTTRKERILKELEAYTLNYVQNGDPSARCGLSAEIISDALLLDRANTSRILNDLYNSGFLIKTYGKPTYFLHKEILSQLYPNIYIPNTLPKDQSILRYINSPAVIEEETGSLRHYDNVTKIGIERSLSRPFEIACSAISYPPHGLHTLVVGQYGSGRRGFIRELHRYAIEHKTLSEDAPLIFCDCREYRDSEPNLLTALFGEGKTDNRRARKGLLEMAGGGFLVLQGTESIDIETLRRISALLTNQTYSRIGEAGYPRACSCIIICQANPDYIDLNSDLNSFYNSFPVRVDIPKYTERDTTEILDYIFYFFKRETSNMNLTVSVPKEVVSLIMQTSYTDSVTKLANAIKATCASAHFHHQKKESRDEILIIQKKDLPDQVLSMIREDPSYLSSVNTILNQFKEDSFRFIPTVPLEIK